MNISGITWRGPSVDDVEMLRKLPPGFVRILCSTNGFILHDGVLHVRGACVSPEWHSLRAALQGPTAFHALYESVRVTDIPFAQDQLGDQFLLRDDRVLKLFAESGEVEPLADSLDDFFRRASEDITAFLNVGLGHTLLPGHLLLAFPPFVVRASGGASLRPVPTDEVILFHADVARQIRDVPDGKEIEVEVPLPTALRRG